MAYWLVKSEPDVFGWDDQLRVGVEPWTGVRNHLAKLNLMAMRQGDLAFFYHSNIGKQVVGVVRVAREAYPDPTVTADAPKGAWVCVDMQAVAPFAFGWMMDELGTKASLLVSAAVSLVALGALLAIRVRVRARPAAPARSMSVH